MRAKRVTETGHTRGDLAARGEKNRKGEEGTGWWGKLREGMGTRPLLRREEKEERGRRKKERSDVEGEQRRNVHIDERSVAQHVERPRVTCHFTSHTP